MDECYWDTHEELMIKLDREPTYEEVIEYWNQKFTMSKEEKSKFQSIDSLMI